MRTLLLRILFEKSKFAYSSVCLPNLLLVIACDSFRKRVNIGYIYSNSVFVILRLSHETRLKMWLWDLWLVHWLVASFSSCHDLDFFYLFSWDEWYSIRLFSSCIRFESTQSNHLLRLDSHSDILFLFTTRLLRGRQTTSRNNSLQFWGMQITLLIGSTSCCAYATI